MSRSLREEVVEAARESGTAGSLGFADDPRPTREKVSLSVPRDTSYLALVRKVVADVAQNAGFDRLEIGKIELAVDEACANAMIYQVTTEGVGKFDQLEVDVVIDRARGGFLVQLRDRGDPFPFDAKGNFDLEDHLRRMEPGGLGIYIIKNFMDEVAYEHSPLSGNTLTMTKFLPGA